jgi:hypothetical protein
MRAERRERGGKFCRWRHQLPGKSGHSKGKNQRFIGVFAMAQGLLIHWREK